MKILKPLFVLAIFITANFSWVIPAQASSVSYSFKTSSQYFDEPSTYTISFLAPKGLKIGYIGVSFSNPYVDLSGASLSVSGISGGTPSIDYDRGISGNHDLQYKLSSVVTLSTDTMITLTVSGAKNPPGPNGSVGFDYISVYDTVNSAHDAFWTYNQENGTSLRLPTNHYQYLKAAVLETPVLDTSVKPDASLEPVVTPSVVTPKPAALPPVVIIQNTTIVSITSIVLAAFFYFDGSQTTNLKKVKDPKHVENFTLDTKFGWTMEYEEQIDFTDKKKLTALQNANKLIVFDYWFIWFRIEWWEYFDVPVTVTYKNPKLTNYAPSFKTENAKSTSTVELVSQNDGELKLKISDAAKISIIPRVEFVTGADFTVKESQYVFKCFSSHKDLEYRLKVNGKETDLQAKNIDVKTGAFEFDPVTLEEGNNFVQLMYKEKTAKEYSIGDEVTIKYKNSLAVFDWLKNKIALVIIAIVGAGIAIGLTTYIQRRKILPPPPAPPIA